MATEKEKELWGWGAVAASPSASPPPVISDALSLNSRLQLLTASSGVVYGIVPASPSSSHFGPLDARRALERETSLAPAGAEGSSMPVDRRKMRMIKNLESATRSRARKKAHLALIETEVMQLPEANQQLRLQYDQLKATAEVSVSVKKTLQRVLSAPF